MHAQIKFMPGRVDSPVADTAELLPAFEDDFMHTLHYFYQSGEGRGDYNLEILNF